MICRAVDERESPLERVVGGVLVFIPPWFEDDDDVVIVYGFVPKEGCHNSILALVTI